MEDGFGENGTVELGNIGTTTKSNTKNSTIESKLSKVHTDIDDSLDEFWEDSKKVSFSKFFFQHYNSSF